MEGTSSNTGNQTSDIILGVGDIIKRYLIAATWVYFTILFGWLVLYMTTSDRFGPISVVNMLAVYLFLPLPLVLFVGIYTHHREVVAGSILGLLVFTLFWGRLFTPNFASVTAEDEQLKIMTYNLLGKQSFTSKQIEIIRHEDPDIVFMQEVNPTMAEDTQNLLSEKYPYQILDPIPGAAGMGSLSKYPIELTKERLPLNWIGRPQVMEMEWKGRSVILINFHMQSSVAGRTMREAQAKVIADFASQTGALIAGGDANTAPLNSPYHILSGALKDSWVEAGFGLGHTLPGSAIPGSSRPRLAGILVPKWLMRIDYIFHSPHWRAISAHTAPFDGVSDHRGVVATLVWNSDN